MLEEELLVPVHRFLVHPYEHGFEATSYVWHVVGTNYHFPTGYVYLVLQRDCHALRTECAIQFPLVCHDALDVAPFHAGQGYYLVTLTYRSACHLATKAPKVQVGSEHVLDREAEVVHVAILVNGYGL